MQGRKEEVPLLDQLFRCHDGVLLALLICMSHSEPDLGGSSQTRQLGAVVVDLVNWEVTSFDAVNVAVSDSDIEVPSTEW